MSKYRVQITKIDEVTGEEDELMDENLQSVLVLGDCDNDKMVEAGYHISLSGIASLIASSKKTFIAALMAVVMKKYHDEEAEDFEESLKEQIEGGNE